MPFGQKGITAKEQSFGDHFIKNGDATAAYLAAGYADMGEQNRKQAYKILRRKLVASYVAKAKGKQLKRLEINADEVLQELYFVARCDIGEAFDEHGNLRALNMIPEAVRRSISSYSVEETEFGKKVKVTFWDKLKANELLGKHLAMWIERMELRTVDRAAELAIARARVLRLQAEASSQATSAVTPATTPDPVSSDQEPGPQQ